MNKLLSWNINYQIGERIFTLENDETKKVDRIYNYLEEQNPDILFVQESHLFDLTNNGYKYHGDKSLCINYKEEKFEKLSTDYINTKSLIILNEDDELVSYEKTKKIIKEKRLNNWKIVKISKKNVLDSTYSISKKLIFILNFDGFF